MSRLPVAMSSFVDGDFKKCRKFPTRDHVRMLEPNCFRWVLQACAAEPMNRLIGFSASLQFYSRPLLQHHGICSQASLATQETVAEIRSFDVYEGPIQRIQAPHPGCALRHLVSALECGKVHYFRVIDLMKFKMDS